MHLTEAINWVLDSSDTDPYEDERYKRVALRTDKGFAYIIHFGICYDAESFLCCSYKLREDKTALFWSRYSHAAHMMATDPFLPKDFWVPLALDSTRKKLFNSKHVLMLSLDIPLLKGIGR